MGAYVNIHAELMAHFDRKLWHKLWISIKIIIKGECTTEECMEVLDSAGKGGVTVEGIQVALRDLLSYLVDKEEMSLVIIHPGKAKYRITKGENQIFGAKSTVMFEFQYQE